MEESIEDKKAAAWMRDYEELEERRAMKEPEQLEEVEEEEEEIDVATLAREAEQYAYPPAKSEEKETNKSSKKIIFF